MRRALDTLYLGAGYLAGLFLIAIFLLMIGLSGGRQIGLNIPAGDDLVSWCMAACSFLGLAHTFKSGEMIRVGLLFDRLKGTTRTVFEVSSLLVAGAMIWYFTWYAVRLTYYSWKFNDVAQGVLPIPLWIPQVGFAIGLIVLSIALVDELVRVVTGLKPSYEKDEPDTAEDVVERAMQSGV